MKFAILTLGLALLAGCSSDPSSTSAAETSGKADTRAPEAMHYSGRVDFDPAGGSLSAEVDIHLSVDPDEAKLAFLLNGELELTEVSGAAVVGFDSGPMQPGADWNRVTVTLTPEPDARWIDLRFVYAGSPTMPENGINQISETWVELSIDTAWHPVVAAIDREFTIEVELGLPTDWAVISSGEASPITDGFLLSNDIRHADIAFAAAPGLDVARGDGFAVYHRRAASETTKSVLTAAAACRRELDRRFGTHKQLPNGRFVITDRSEGGYARKNFIALTEVAGQDEARLTTFLCHELAHFWSSGAMPLTVDNWLNESFAVLVAAQAARGMFGDESWDKALADWRERAAGQPSIWTPDNLDRRPFEINYKKGPLALVRLEEEIGEETFDRLLVRYMTDPIDSTPDLLDAIEAEAGSSARTWFEAVLAEDDTE